MAKALLAFGADKTRAIALAEKFGQEKVQTRLTHKLKLEKEDVQGFFFWAVNQYKVAYGLHLINKLLSLHYSEEKPEDDVQDFMGAMIELAVFNHQPAVVKKLLEKGKPRFRDQCSAGYWAVVHDDQIMYALVCPDESAQINTLRQVRAYRPNAKIKPYFDMLSPDAQKEFLVPSNSLTVPSALPPKLSAIYKEAATHNDNYNLKLYNANLSLNEYRQLFKQAFVQKNYIVLHQLCTLPNTDQRYDIYLSLLEKHAKLASFIVLAANIDRYLAALQGYARSDKKSDFFSPAFIMQGEEAGILQQLVSRNVRLKDTPTRQEQDVRKNLIASKVSPLLSDAILRCLYDRHPKQEIELLLTLPLPLAQRMIRTPTLPSNIVALITERANRFGMPLVVNNNNQRLPNVLLDIIFKFCDAKTLTQIPEVCRSWKNVMDDPTGAIARKEIKVEEDKKISLSNKETRYQRIPISLAAINHYLEAQQTYIDTRGCLDHRFKNLNWGTGSFIFIALALAAGFSTCGALLANTVPAIAPAEDLYDQTNFNGTSCPSYFSFKCFPADDFPITPAICLALCHVFNDLLKKQEGLAVGTGWIGGFLILILLCIYWFDEAFIYTGPNRFDTLSINEFSPTVVRAAQGMFRENAERFQNTDPRRHSAGALRESTQDTRTSLTLLSPTIKSEIDTLRKELKLPTYEEAQEIKKQGEAKKQAVNDGKITIVIDPMRSTGLRLFDSAAGSNTKLPTKTQTNYGSLDNDESDNSNLSLSTPLLTSTTEDSAAIDMDNLGISLR